MMRSLLRRWAEETSNDGRPPLLRYGVAVLAVGLALGFFVLLQRDGFPLLLAAVAFAAWFGGLRPGLLATGSSMFVLVSSLLITQNGQLPGPVEVERMVLFTLLSFLIGSLTAAFQSAKRRAEAATLDWRTSEARYRRIVETANEGICSIDPAGRTDYVNPRMAEMLGYSPEEMLGRPLSDFMDDSLSDRAVLVNRVKEQFDARFRRKDGSEMRAIVSASPVQDHHGHAIGSLAMIMDITERKRIETELKRERDFISAVLETAGCLVVVQDHRGRIVRFNRSCEELTGYSLEEVKDRVLWEFLLTGVEATAQEAKFAELSAEELAKKHENHWLTKQGRARRIAWSNTTLLDSQGSVEYVIGTGIDITERRQAEEALRQSEERYALAVRGSSDGLWDWNILTDETYVSPRFRELTGSEGAESDGVPAPFGSKLHDADRDRVMQALNDHIERQVPFDVEYRLRTNGGEYRWFHSLGQAIWDETGKATRMAGSLRDITERKRSEEALRASEARYRLLFERNLAGVLRCTEDGMVLDCNESFARILGYDSREQLMARPAWDFFDQPADREAMLARLRQEHVVSNYELRSRRKDGSLGWILTNVILMEGKDGAANIQATSIDITERKRAEEALRESESVLRSFYDSAAMAMGVVEVLDADVMCLSANATTAKLLGLPAEGLQGRFASETGFTKERLDIFLEKYIQSAQIGQPVRFEYSSALPQSPPWISVTVCPLGRSPAGRPRFSFIAEDITERKWAEEVLRDSEERHRLLFESNPQPMWVYDSETLAFLAVNEAAIRHYGYSRDEFLTMTIAELSPPEDLPALFNECSDEKNNGFRSSQVARHRKQDETIFDVEITSGVVTFSGRPARVVLANDVTVRQRAENALRRRNRELVAFNAVAAVINRSLRLPDVLATLKGLLGEKLGIGGGGIFLYDEADRRLYLHTGWGLPLELLAEINRLLNIDAHNGKAYWKETAIFKPDFHKGSPFISTSHAEDRPEWQNCLCVPFGAKGDVEGVLLLFNRLPVPFGEEQLDFYAVLGKQVGVAIQNARLFEQVRASRKRLKALSLRLVEVQEAERRSIARELHDEIGQVLTGLKLSLEMTSRLPAEKRTVNLEEPQALVNRLLAQVRALSLDLRPTMLDDLGLKPALLWHFEQYTTQTGIRVAFEHAGLDRRFPPEVETAAYRIVQEALTNVARHAGVQEVTMRLWANQHTLGVQVKDQGVGFDPAAPAAASASSGLSGMHERVFLLRGRLTVESALGAGTSLSAELPLNGLPKRAKKERRV